ncbi:MAG: putative hydroxymethylpyrimidine transporter CytX [Armatimonadetes bacterium]|nr:putative hydroxymethylpyrimidine transporter CytX [Armatimonadota bacterium]MDW8153429.1 putative hydroxymethylpyrimidine transporter CytX [Armatimonadota bacterium]
MTAAVSEREVVTEWGIEPLPEARRPLGGWDIFVLWLNLGISLLLLVAGALLVPGLGLRDALLATAVGVVLGNLLLGLGAWMGMRVGVPSMVLLRAPLGITGSAAPTILNILQNIGWGAFELLIITQSADAITRRILGASSSVAWVAAFGLLTTLMAVGGPIVVVRRWLRKYAIWFVVASTLYLTWYALFRFDVAGLWNQPGTGRLPFWLGVDLVVAMPVSWIPLVADYTRFGSDPRAAFWGTALGYGLANFWFYALGALFMLALRAEDLIAAVLAIPAGAVALGILLVDETDEAFANIYSTSVSLQNLWPHADRRRLAVGVGGICSILAATIPLAQYEAFLFLIGAFFVPLFGVLVADYFVVRRGHLNPDDLYGPQAAGVRWGAFVPWLAGFLLYQWIVPTEAPGWKDLLTALFRALGLPFPLSASLPWLGASLPSFLAAFLLHALLGGLVRRQGRAT